MTWRTEYRKNKENEDILRDLWDNIKCTNICILGVPEGEEREKGSKKIFEEIIAENFPNMVTKFNGEIKSFPDKQKLREFSTTKPALQQMLKEIS